MAWLMVLAMVGVGALVGYWAVRRPTPAGRGPSLAARVVAPTLGAVGGLVLAGALGYLGMLWAPRGHIEPVTTIAELEAALAGDEPVAVLYFSSRGCAPCGMLKSRLLRLQERWRGRARFIEADTALAPQLVQHFGVRATPTLVFFHGLVPTTALEGVVPAARIEALLGELQHQDQSGVIE